MASAPERPRAGPVASALAPTLLRLEDVPAVPGVEIAHAYEAATRAGGAGSDLYDVFEIDRGRVAVVIGDVSGRGEASIELASLVRETVRTYAGGPSEDMPARVFSAVNERVLAEAPADAFTTLIFGVLAPDSGRFLYSNAGHVPFLVVSETRIVELPASTTILGVFEKAQVMTSQMMLAPEAVLLLLTNGVADSRGPDGPYGRSRLWERLSDCEPVTPCALVSCVLDDVIAYAGTSRPDDMAVLAIRRSR